MHIYCKTSSLQAFCIIVIVFVAAVEQTFKCIGKMFDYQHNNEIVTVESKFFFHSILQMLLLLNATGDDAFYIIWVFAVFN